MSGQRVCRADIDQVSKRNNIIWLEIVSCVPFRAKLIVLGQDTERVGASPVIEVRTGDFQVVGSRRCEGENNPCIRISGSSSKAALIPYKFGSRCIVQT